MNRIITATLSQIKIRTDKIQYSNPNFPNEKLACRTIISDALEKDRQRLIRQGKGNNTIQLDIDPNNRLLNKDELIAILTNQAVNAYNTHSRNGRFMLSDWHYITFFDKKFSFRMPGLTSHQTLNEKSRSLFEHLKSYFAFHALTYIVDFVNDKPTKIEIPDDVFDILDVGALIHQIRDNRLWTSFRLINQISKKLESLSGRNLVRKFKGFLNTDRSYYFNILGELHDPNTQIKVLLEPQFYNKSLDGYDFSFLYQIKRNNRYFAIWESLEPNKATFIFEFQNLNEYTNGIAAFFDCLKNPHCFHGRDDFRCNGIEGLPQESLSRLFHKPYAKEDVDWRNNLRKKIGK